MPEVDLDRQAEFIQHQSKAPREDGAIGRRRNDILHSQLLGESGPERKKIVIEKGTGDAKHHAHHPLENRRLDQTYVRML